jgi:hypothetical protein
MAVQFKQIDKAPAWQNASYATDGGLVMPQSTCRESAGFGGGKLDENYSRSAKIRKNIEALFKDLLAVLEQFRVGLMEGDLKRNQSSLALYIGHPALADAVKRLRDDRSGLEW